MCVWMLAAVVGMRPRAANSLLSLGGASHFSLFLLWGRRRFPLSGSDQQIRNRAAGEAPPTPRLADGGPGWTEALQI